MAKVKNLNIDQGSSFSQTFIASDSAGNVLSITGATGYSYLRLAHDSSHYYQFSVVAGNTAGYYSLNLSATGSAILKPGKYLYDVEFHFADDTVFRDRQGTAIVDGEMTRDYGTLVIPTTEISANFRGPTGPVGATGPGLPYVLTIKPSDQTIPGSGVQNYVVIEGMTTAFEANSSYSIEGSLLYDNAPSYASRRPQLGVSVTGDAALYFYAGNIYFDYFSADEMYLSQGGAGFLNNNISSTTTPLSTDGMTIIYLRGFVRTLLAGEFSLKFGGDGNDFGDITIHANSYIKLTKLN